MLGTTIFDEGESTKIIDFRVESISNNNNNNNNNNYVELAHSNDTSFVSSCQRFQVVSWSENGNVAKIAVFDRTYGCRPSRLVRLTANFPLSGLAVTQVPSTIFGNNNNNQQNLPPALEVGVFLCSNVNGTTRLHFTRLVISFDQDELLIHKAKQTISNPLVANDEDDSENEGQNQQDNSFVSAFGFCSSFSENNNNNSEDETSSFVTVAVAKSNGLVSLVRFNPANGEDIDQVWFSVDDYWRNTEIMNLRIAKQQQQQGNQMNNKNNNKSVSSNGQQQQQQQQQQSGIGKIFSWFSGSGNNNNDNNSNNNNTHNNASSSNNDFDDEVELLRRRAINYVTSLSYCPATDRLFLSCSCGALMFFVPNESSQPELVPIPGHLQVRQALSAAASSSANAVRLSTRFGAEDEGYNVVNTSSLYIVADDISGMNGSSSQLEGSSARYLMALDTSSLQTTSHWSAPALSSHSRCVRIEPPRMNESLDMCYAVWQVPENNVSIIWSPSFGVAYVSMPLQTFFVDTADEQFPINVVTPGGRIMCIREAARMTALERSIASLAVASRPALNDATAVLFPSKYQGGARATLLAHPVGGSDLIDADPSLPAAIKAGIAILSQTQMWSEFDATLAQLLSDPDSNSNVATLTRFVDMIALAFGDDESTNGNNKNLFSNISTAEMSEATRFLTTPENIVRLNAASNIRSRRWIADRLSQSLFSAICGLLLARIAWACSNDQDDQDGDDDDENTNNNSYEHDSNIFSIQQQVNQASMLLASGYHVVTSLGSQCTLLINSAARNENDSDTTMIAKCLGVLLRGDANSIVDSSDDASNNNNNEQQPSAVIINERAVVMVAHRLLKAAQDYSRSKPLAVWVAFWKKEFPIVCHFAAVLIAAHHTHDARPGVASMLFAQHLHSVCAALTSSFEIEDVLEQQDNDNENDDDDDAPSFGMVDGSSVPAGHHFSQVQDKNTMCSSIARAIFDLLQGTSAALDLNEVTGLLQRSEYPLFEACRLYRSAMLLLFLNGGGSATFVCEPDLVQSLLCDVKQICAITTADYQAFPQLDRVFSYLLVESSLFLASVDVHRREFFSALQHLSTICRNDGSRKTSVDEIVTVIVQNVLGDRDAQQQLIKASINDEPILRALNDAFSEAIMQPTAPGVSREERDSARVQHTVFFVQFLAARGALGAAARVAHDIASQMRSFSRCNVFTLRSAANLIALAIAICRSIPDVEPPAITSGFGTGATSAGSRSSGGSRAPEMTGLGGNDLDTQGSFFADPANAGMGGPSKTMIFSPQKRAKSLPLSRNHLPELERRLRWILCEAKLAARAPVVRPLWPARLEEGVINDTEACRPNREALISTVRELLHLRMWDDALLLSEAYPEILHPGSVYQVRIHDMLSSELWNNNNHHHSSSSTTNNNNSKMSIYHDTPLTSSSQVVAAAQKLQLQERSSKNVNNGNDNDDEDEEELEDARTKERRIFLTEQWHNVVQDIKSHPTRSTELLRSAIEQVLAHHNGDNIPRFVYDALGDVDPAALLELCLNCSRISYRVTDLAFDIVANFFEEKKYAHLPHVVLPVTLLERLVLGARKVLNDPRLSAHVPKFVLEKAPKVEKMVTRHFKGSQ